MFTKTNTNNGLNKSGGQQSQERTPLANAGYHQVDNTIGQNQQQAAETVANDVTNNDNAAQLQAVFFQQQQQPAQHRTHLGDAGRWPMVSRP
jgi:hypothetical protein